MATKTGQAPLGLGAGPLTKQEFDFVNSYLQDGHIVDAYVLATGIEVQKNKGGHYSGEQTLYQAGYALLNGPNVQEFLTNRRDEARRLAVGVLPDVVQRVYDMIKDPDMNPKLVLQAARLISDMAGLTEPVDDRRIQLLIQNFASIHPQSLGPLNKDSNYIEGS